MTKIGIIKEEKIPIDRRVPVTPDQAVQIRDQYPEVEVYCQKSDIRCFTDEEYEKAGIEVMDDVSHCDILMGVKEVPANSLVPNKTYLFFSHTIKEQAYNRPLLRQILRDKIKLIDYECLTNEKGHRVVAFGRYAGIVGAYNGILTYGRKYQLFSLRRAYECFDLADLKKECEKVSLPPVKIVITGGGRVAGGAMEILEKMAVRQADIEDFLTKTFDGPVYTQLDSEDYHTRKDGLPFDLDDFYAHPENYSSDFLKFTEKSDILIAAAYWNPSAPVLFTRDDMKGPDFRIKAIADITCDIEGSIPSTIRASTIDRPVYDYDPVTHSEAAPFSGEHNISVMAVDNLPCELPRDASVDFGKELINNVIPNILQKSSHPMITHATIAENGRLGKNFTYLQDFVDGK